MVELMSELLQNSTIYVELKMDEFQSMASAKEEQMIAQDMQKTCVYSIPVNLHQNLILECKRSTS